MGLIFFRFGISFFAIISLKLEGCRLLPRMSAPQGPIDPEPVETTKAKKKTAPRGAGKSRQPGRPHKRLLNEVLQARAAVLSKKLQVLQAKRRFLRSALKRTQTKGSCESKSMGGVGLLLQSSVLA